MVECAGSLSGDDCMILSLRPPRALAASHLKATKMTRMAITGRAGRREIHTDF